MSNAGGALIATIPALAGRIAATLVTRLFRLLGWLFTLVRRGVAAGRRRWATRPGARVRDLRRRATEPLPNLYDVYPEARRATPREIGLRAIDIDDIEGTAVAGAAQRGADFLPLKPFRSKNWASRWQRILRAIDNLAILPPVDLVRYGGKYWVLDGHNRVAAAHRVGQVEVDANVTELVPPGQNPSERPGNLAAALTGTTALRSAGQGGRFRMLRDDEVATVGIPAPNGSAGGLGAPAAPGPAELVAPAAEPPAVTNATYPDDPSDPPANRDSGAPPATS